MGQFVPSSSLVCFLPLWPFLFIDLCRLLSLSPSLLMLLGVLSGAASLQSLNTLPVQSHGSDNLLFTDNFKIYNYQSNLFPKLRLLGISVYMYQTPKTQQNELTVLPPSHSPPIFLVLVSGAPILLVLWCHSS